MKKHTIILGLLATMGIFIVGTGEWLILFNPNGGYGFADYDFLSNKSTLQITIAHFLIVLAAPSYFLGYYFISQNLNPAKLWLKKTFLFLSIYTFSMAMMWVSARSYLAIAVSQKFYAPEAGKPFIQNIIDGISGNSDPLLFMVWGLLLVLSGLFSYLVFTKQSNFPRYFAGFSPVIILALVFLSYFLIPQVGVYLLPTAMNIVHIILFGTGTYLLWKKS